VTNARLSSDDEAAVQEAIAALEIAEGIVPASAFVALRDPALRAVVSKRLEACGRSLIAIEQGWSSGYRDDIADTLQRLGIGVLTPADRAVLALVLLRTVAIPRARGELRGTVWTTANGARATSIDELNQNRHIPKKQLTESVRRLRVLGLLRPGHRADIVPGPAMHRLSSQRAAWLWEDLLLLAAPDSTYARVLRARRAQQGRPSPALTPEER